jgi:hypothetical protein
MGARPARRVDGQIQRHAGKARRVRTSPPRGPDDHRRRPG